MRATCLLVALAFAIGSRSATAQRSEPFPGDILFKRDHTAATLEWRATPTGQE